jgi:hypothetical protein
MAEPQNGRIGGGVLADNLLRQSINLNFKNTTSDTALLHLDVNNNRIGVNNESSSVVLDVNNEFSSSEIFLPYLDVANFTFQNNEITANVGSIFFNAATNVQVSSIVTNDLKIDFNTVRSITPNTNIEVRPDGTGNLDIHSNLNISGNLHATGDITFGGNLTLGDNDTDNVFFDADVNSNFVPDLNNTYNLGSSTKKWQNLYSNLLNGQRIEVTGLTVGDASLALRQGNIFYVSTNGSDSNVGDHQHGPFRTIKHALTVVDSSSVGPVTIFVFPGEYDEDCPLLVPEFVTITGEDIRNVIIRPTTSTQSEDVFHVSQNTLIENITVKDFYYDSINNTGYAFRFASNTVINQRSPYIRNVTVITQGTSTSGTDPRGFDSGDAGKGAWIDGLELTPNSNEASMLFHSATFITPGVDCITMTNGVRVEWLNSFTYFADRGLYAINGTGRTSADGSTVLKGAEIRSIGSANVYGNYGAVADGNETLMYLISQNFAYIGTGKRSDNDNLYTLQDQEAVQINGGRIYYTSTDAEGTFRIGNAFYVNFETGTTSFDASAIDFSGVSSIFIYSGSNLTYIDGNRIDTGNIRISGNTIQTLTGDLIWTPATGFVDVSSNVGFIIPRGTIVQRTLEESDFRYNTSTNLFEGYSSTNIHFGGVYSENRLTNVNARNLQGDIIFTVNNVERGRVANGAIQLTGLTNGNILINNNIIRTTESNSDLELTTRSGTVLFNDLSLVDNSITNLENTNLSIFHTGNGYLKINSTLGFVVPSGNTSERPVSPDIGTTRYNYEEDYLETWNGTAWQRSAGEGATVTTEVMEELLEIYTLIFG